MIPTLGAACYWHETATRVPGPQLEERLDVDVAIVGAGYTGLWTAFHLIESNPSLNIVILEQSTLGYGASGRNGGFAMTLLDLSLAQLRANQGDAAARAAHEAVAASVEEIGNTIATHGIECEWRHGGLMVVATNAGQQRKIDAELATADALGLEGFTRLSQADAQAVTDSPTYVGALREEHCGVLHPAKLVHGLARLVTSRGVRIFEGTATTSLTESPDSLTITTERGSVRAQQIVLATNAWARDRAELRRAIAPLYTYIILTEPLSAEQWASVGWDDHCGIEDKRNFVHYYRRTDDGRILWGGSDGVVPYQGSINSGHDRNEHVRRRLESTFRRTFPQLASVRFTHHWGGPIALTANFVPTYGSLANNRLHYGTGCNGHGVAPCHTGGKILRDKVLGHASPLTELCFVDRSNPTFPPEPVAWLGSELARRSLKRQDDRLEAGDPWNGNEPLVMRIMRKLG